MMAALLDQAAERGEPIAALFASEGAIYGRFGYGLAAFYGEFQAESARMDFVRGYAPRPGRAPHEGGGAPVIGRVYDAVAPARWRRADRRDARLRVLGDSGTT